MVAIRRIVSVTLKMLTSPWSEPRNKTRKLLLYLKKDPKTHYLSIASSSIINDNKLTNQKLNKRLQAFVRIL